ncbi:hypothetical protein V9T40_010540 [Parthenolecanium corni]|uniref:Uncharacterized protein n=1 Tax=Parthenolecanium corni TaxID=536013 RepID=A0AAN9T554_9HEMI
MENGDEKFEANYDHNIAWIASALSLPYRTTLSTWLKYLKILCGNSCAEQENGTSVAMGELCEASKVSKGAERRKESQVWRNYHAAYDDDDDDDAPCALRASGRN